MTVKAWTALAVAAGLGLAATALAWRAVADGKPSDASGENAKASTTAVRVESVPVTYQHLQRFSEAVPAEVLPYEKTDLSAKVSGYLQKINVDYGDPVTEGELLATIWIPELTKEYEQKEAIVARAEADVRLARSAVVVAEADYRRFKSQYERLTRAGRGGVIGRESVEETQFSFESSEAKRDMARADVGVKEANVQVAKADRDRVAALLKYTRIVAPYNGVITRRYLHTGALLNTTNGELPILLTVVRTDRLRIVVDVPEKDVPYLDKDDWVTLNLDALPGKEFRWPITRMAPVLGGGKKVRVEVDLRNPGPFYPGMYGHAKVILEDKPKALTLPKGCVSHDDKGAFVWRAADGKATRRRITVGITEGDKIEIVSGLKAGEEVLRGSTAALREGQAIEVRVAPAEKNG